VRVPAVSSGGLKKQQTNNETQQDANKAAKGATTDAPHPNLQSTNKEHPSIIHGNGLNDLNDGQLPREALGSKRVEAARQDFRASRSATSAALSMASGTRGKAPGHRRETVACSPSATPRPPTHPENEARPA
jgi:hypothetical protein